MKLEGLDALDIRILENLYETTNISEIARRVGASDETVRRRIQKLYRYGRIIVEPDYFAMGLSYAAYIADWPSSDSALKLLEECYLKSITRLITPTGRKIFITLIPPLHLENVMQAIVETLLGPGTFIPLMNPVKWRPSYLVFNEERKELVFPWDEALKMLLKGNVTLRFRGNCRQTVIDPIDLAILEELQTDALTPLTRVAKEKGVYQQKLWYHYTKHVKPLIRFNNVNMALIPPNKVPRMLHKISFINHEILHRFIGVNILNPFFVAILPFRYSPEAFVITGLPSDQMLCFIKVLSELSENGLVKSYEWLGIVDPSYLRAYTIPSADLLVNGRWIIKKSVMEKVLPKAVVKIRKDK